MSRACWTYCVSCTHRFCEFCIMGSQYENKKKYKRDIVKSGYSGGKINGRSKKK